MVKSEQEVSKFKLNFKFWRSKSNVLEQIVPHIFLFVCFFVDHLCIYFVYMKRIDDELLSKICHNSVGVATIDDQSWGIFQQLENLNSSLFTFKYSAPTVNR